MAEKIEICVGHMQMAVRAIDAAYGVYRFVIVGRNYSVLTTLVIAVAAVAAVYSTVYAYLSGNYCNTFGPQVGLELCQMSMKMVSMFIVAMVSVVVAAVGILMVVHRAYSHAAYIRASINGHDV